MAAVPLLRHQTTTVAQQVAIPPANQQHRTQAPSLFQWKKARISNLGLVMLFFGGMRWAQLGKSSLDCLWQLVL